MAWKKVAAVELAASLGINASDVREKQKIIQLILAIRKDRKISQATLAKKIGVSQGRIAQIESGIGTAKVSFDMLLNLIRALGYDFKIVVKKAAY
jgi:transcriptional regulator with XRE-family HTH domain